MNQPFLKLSSGIRVKIKSPISSNVILGIIEDFCTNNSNTFVKLSKAVLVDLSNKKVTNYWVSENVLIDIDSMAISLPNTEELSLLENMTKE